MYIMPTRNLLKETGNFEIIIIYIYKESDQTEVKVNKVNVNYEIIPIEDKDLCE